MSLRGRCLSLALDLHSIPEHATHLKAFLLASEKALILFLLIEVGWYSLRMVKAQRESRRLDGYLYRPHGLNNGDFIHHQSRPVRIGSAAK